MIVVAYYTDDYMKYAPGLLRSCERFGLRHEIVHVRDRGSYTKNVAYKAEFLLWQLIRHRTDDILYIDVDAEIVGELELLRGISFPISACFWKATDKDEVPPMLLGGTIHLHGRDRGVLIPLLDTWIEENHKNGDKTDQENLASALLRHPKIAPGSLPPGYCWIEEVMRAHRPKEPVVIRHFTASRERWMK